MSFDALEQSRYSSDPVELFKFQVGATTYYYTSADAVVVVGGVNYMPEPILRARIDQTRERDSGSVQITIGRLNPVAALFMPYSPVAPVAVTIQRQHRSDAEAILAFVGFIASAKFEEGSCTLMCSSAASTLSRLLPGLYYQRQCNHALFGPGCGVNRLTYKDAATLTFVSGATIKAAVFATHADGWYENGYVETAELERRHVVSHAGDTLVLLAPIIGLVVGGAIDAYPGCDRTEATCTSKYNNLDNHEGYPRIPIRNAFDRGVT